MQNSEDHQRTVNRTPMNKDAIFTFQNVNTFVLSTLSFFLLHPQQLLILLSIQAYQRFSIITISTKSPQEYKADGIHEEAAAEFQDPKYSNILSTPKLFCFTKQVKRCCNSMKGKYISSLQSSQIYKLGYPYMYLYLSMGK